MWEPWAIAYVIIGLLSANMLRIGDDAPYSFTGFMVAWVFWLPLMVVFNVVSLSKVAELLKSISKGMDK
jgi:hypothetical protein